MASVSFPSPDGAEVIEVDFVRLDGSPRSLKLLVDTGFTGKSSVIIGANDIDLIRAGLPSTETTGALKGQQNRAWVTCRIGAMKFQATMIAIVADLSALSLPIGVDGLVGLSFLRQFARWGARRSRKGWTFSLYDRAN